MAQSQKNTDLVTGNNSFCKKLYESLKKNKGNIFYSPASLQYALALLYAGAEGQTAKEIQSILMLPDSKDATYRKVSESLSELTSCQNVTLNIADGLFIQDKFKVKPQYVEVAKKYFLSVVSNVDFGNDSAIKTINTFVAKETKDKIKDLIKKEMVDPLTKLVIVNAIYFKGNWASKFDPKNTFKGDFHLDAKNKVQVDFMTQTSKFRVAYPESLDSAVVVMPYQGGKLSMVLIVPNEVEGLKKLEEKITQVNLSDIVKDAHSEEIVLTMPKFKVMDELNLKNTLCELGMKEMFSDKANLTGISDEGLFVSNVVQKSFIEVNEEGSEAAAATGLVMQVMSMPMEVQANRPFMFVIQDDRTSCTLFCGRISQF